MTNLADGGITPWRAPEQQIERHELEPTGEGTGLMQTGRSGSAVDLGRDESLSWANDADLSGAPGSDLVGYGYGDGFGPIDRVAVEEPREPREPKLARAISRVASSAASVTATVAVGVARPVKRGALKAKDGAAEKIALHQEARRVQTEAEQEAREDLARRQDEFNGLLSDADFFDAQVLPGIHQDIRNRRHAENEAALYSETRASVEASLRAPEPIGSSILTGTRIEAALGRSVEAQRASNAFAEVSYFLPAAEISADVNASNVGRKDIELALPVSDDARRGHLTRMADGIMGALKAAIPEPLDELFDDEVHISYRNAISEAATGVIDKAQGKALNLHYRLGTEDAAAHEHAAFLELVATKGLGPENWTQQIDADGTTMHLLKDEVTIVRTQDDGIELIPNPDVSGFARVFDDGEGQFHNLIPGHSVEGYVKTLRHPNLGGTGIKAVYYTDQFIPPTQEDPRLRAVMFTHVSPVALTSEGLGVVQDESNRIFRKQQVSALVDPLVAAEEALVAKALALLDAGRFSLDVLTTAQELSQSLPLAPMRQSDTNRHYGRLLADAMDASDARNSLGSGTTGELTQ